MGFIADDTVTVRFKENHRYHGLEAVLRSMSMRTYMRVTGYDGDEPETVADSIARFAESLVSWNLQRRDDQGQVVDVPATPEAVWEQDHGMILELSSAWLEALSGVHKNDPLEATSPAGEPLVDVASIPMAPLSPSLAS